MIIIVENIERHKGFEGAPYQGEIIGIMRHNRFHSSLIKYHMLAHDVVGLVRC